MVEKTTVDSALSVTRLAGTAIKDVWSRLDAASDKPRPSEYLGQKATHAIQGVQVA